MNAVTPTVVERDRSPMPAGMAPMAIVPQTFEQAWRFAELVTRSGMAPKGFEKPEACMVAILHGLEVGLTPLAALQSIAVVNGRPTVWGDGALALVRGSGLCEWVEETVAGEGDAMVATCKAKRRGDPKPSIGTFAVSDAKKAGLWGKSGPWTQYPKRMLAMRARAFAIRDGFADVLRGVSVREEIEDIERASAALATDVTPPRPSAPPPAPSAAPQADRRPPSPPKPPSAPPVIDNEPPADGTDWHSEIVSYDSQISSVEDLEALAESIELYGSRFADAPSEIRGEAKKIEDSARASIERSIND